MSAPDAGLREHVARARARLTALAARTPRRFGFMEVCGTHTHAIARAGLRRLLPPNVKLISGPGCPVCVTPIEYLDRAVALARRPDVIVCTFGDLVRVPSSVSSLERESAAGHDVRIVYSARDAVRIARETPERKVVFLGVGFETTLPTVAAALDEAERDGVDNFLVLVGAKTIEPPLRALVESGDVALDGFLLPGHVSVILGADFYRFLEVELALPGAIVGFEALDILLGIEFLLERSLAGEPRVANLYPGVVRRAGNPTALALLERWFERVDSRWRGLGTIPASGLAFRREFAHRDAARLAVELDPPREPKGCRCGDVLKGAIEPPECPLFDRTCTPTHPVGACMVSSEGTCAAWHRHERVALDERRAGHERHAHTGGRA
ncbi:MAG: hydrogenase formation protein HypD [Planctomycetes bacterium]|nr:hydrogenase formation protein HypD [Planctomycetota bacterium]